MAMLRWTAFALLLLLAFLFHTHAASSERKKQSNDDARGVVLLDSFTYPIVVNEHAEHATFVFVLNKRDLGRDDDITAGLRSDYLSLALEVLRLIDEADTHKLLFGQVVVNGADNGRLGKTFGLDPSAIGPVAGLVRAGTDGDNVIPYTGRMDRTALLDFLQEHVGLHVITPTTDAQFDSLAERFVREFAAHPPTVSDGADVEENEGGDATTVSLSEEVEAVLEDAKAQLEAVRAADGETSESAVLGEHYLKAISKVARAGDLNVAQSEIARLETILRRKEKVAPAKMREAMQRRKVFEQLQKFAAAATAAAGNNEKQEL